MHAKVSDNSALSRWFPGTQGAFPTSHTPNYPPTSTLSTTVAFKFFSLPLSGSEIDEERVPT